MGVQWGGGGEKVCGEEEGRWRNRQLGGGNKGDEDIDRKREVVWEGGGIGGEDAGKVEV